MLRFDNKYFGGAMENMNVLSRKADADGTRSLESTIMVENSAAMGAYFREGLNSIGSRIIKEVRGRGLMLALELHPDAGGARRYCVALKHRGILCKDTKEHTIRISPPLVITREDIDKALFQFAAVLA